MITKKDIIEMTTIIKANYPYAYKDVDNATMQILVETWFNSLKVYDKKLIEVAFKRAIQSCKNPPTLADILEKIQKIVNTTERTDTELWEILVDAVEKAKECVYYFNFGLIEDNGKTQGENARDKFDDIWNNLLPELKDYCGNKHGFLTLTETEMDYEKGRFLRTIPTLRERQNIKRNTDPEILKLVSDLSGKFEISYNNK